LCQGNIKLPIGVDPGDLNVIHAKEYIR